jgi:hypothetical protein
MKKNVERFKGNWESVTEVLEDKVVNKEKIETYELIINSVKPTKEPYFHIKGKKYPINQNEDSEFMILCNWEGGEEQEKLCFHNKIFSMVDYLTYSSKDDMLYVYEFNLSPNILVPINPIYKFSRKVKK